jgi:hypothetical protein
MIGWARSGAGEVEGEFQTIGEIPGLRTHSRKVELFSLPIT